MQAVSGKAGMVWAGWRGMSAALLMCALVGSCLSAWLMAQGTPWDFTTSFFERLGLKRGTPCSAQWMVTYLADSRLCSGPGAKRMAGSEEKGAGGREKVHMNLADTICYFLWNPNFLQPLVSPHSLFCHHSHLDASLNSVQAVCAPEMSLL